MFPSRRSTAGFKFNHTMLRITDPDRSLPFYKDVLGMDLLSKHVFDDFTLYFLAFNHSGHDLTDDEKKDSRFAREGVLELTHNHGTESNPDFKGYASGNTDPGRGFGHIAISVDDVERACEHFEKSGVPFKKKANRWEDEEYCFHT